MEGVIRCARDRRKRLTRWRRAGNAPTVAEGPDSGAKALERALGELYRARERAPGDPSVLRQIQAVRDQITTAALERLRPLDRVVHRVGRVAPQTPAETYLVEQCIDGATSIDVILDRSTLGRHRTAQALESLLGSGLAELRTDKRSFAPRSAFGPRTETSTPSVVVADASATQAALMRTMTRVAIHGVSALTAARFLGASSGSELVEVVLRERVTLMVTSFQLPGFDALEAIRQLRARGRSIGAVILVEQLDASFVQPKLPEGAAILARPFDKAALHAAITTMLAASASRL
jgi:CheY-like chemotaxis protein